MQLVVHLSPGRALAALVMWVAVQGCQSDPAPVPFLRLVDLDAAARGLREGETAATGDTTRYVFRRDHPGQVKVLDGVPSPRLEVTCPAGSEGRGLKIFWVCHGVTVAPEDVPLRSLHCPKEAAHARRLRWPVGCARSPEALIMRALVMPPTTVQTDWIEAPAGAMLEVSIGDIGLFRAQARSAAFRLTAFDPAGKRLVLAERRVAPTHDGWIPLEIPLDPARRRLGDRFRLHFRVSIDRRSMRAPVWGDPTIVVPRRAVERPPRRSVLLISLDTLRADHLGSYGFSGPISPQLDAFAREGARCETVVSSASWTAPAHATMFTGLHPCGHTIGSGFGLVHPLPAGVVPLAEAFRSGGWRTAAITEDGYVDPTMFHRGFDEFYAHPRPRTGVIDETFARATAWLRQRAGADFFLFVHTYQVHAPYDPPAALAEAFRDVGAPLPDAVNVAKYRAEVAHTDDRVGQLLRTIDELGLRDRTLVIVTSDHGEAFGEHKNQEHGGTVYDEELLVPLLWRAPGMIPPGVVVKGMAGLVDVAPTILDLLDLPVPDWAQGQSLKPMLTSVAPTRWLSGQRVLPVEAFFRRGIRGLQWKAVFDGVRWVTFALQVDPGEQRAIPATSGHRFTSAQKVLEAECARTNEILARTADARVVPVRPVDPNLAERLRGLGYVP